MSDSARGLTVVLTGSSSGIGSAAARQLAAEGATVCLLARRAERLNQLVHEIADQGGTAHAYPVDLTDAESTDAVVAALLADHPRIDVLVNNAGRSIRRGIADALDRLHDYERTLAINYIGAVRLTLGIMPRFLEQGHGHVVVSSTLSTQVPIPLFSAYLGSKSALESFARSLAAEHAHAALTSTIVHFPMVRTPMSGATDIYAAMPMMSADEAGAWLRRAAIDRPRRITTLRGALSQLGMSIAPGMMTKLVTPQIRRMDQRLVRRRQR